MPYADNDGVRIHYCVEGTGPPLVLLHGFTDSLESWYEQGYVAALRPSYRVVLVDSRGHGASDKPHDPDAYVLEKRAGDVVAVLDALGLAKAHFWGYSMGSWIGFGMAQFAPGRVDRLVVGGPGPRARSLEATRQMVRAGIAGGDALIAAVEERYGFEASPATRERLRAADPEALLAAAVDRPSLEHILPGMRMPCLLYAGEADPLFAEAKAAAPLIANARFFSLPGLSHVEGFFRADLVLPKVVPFLASTSPVAS
jgi:pimeloyl-ACP methyl ester carboxylesterase